MSAILSIQSWVAYGHVGNAAAMFPLQRMGFEVMAVNTVQFSNHTGYGAWRGEIFKPEALRDVIQGIGERGALDRCAGILTGYTGDPALGDVILETVARVRAANPKVLWCCDPVMGDVGRGFFVQDGLPAYFRDRAVPKADIVTPNQFELEYLTGRQIVSVEDAMDAVAALRRMGPDLVLLTSLRCEGMKRKTVHMLAADGDGAWLISTPELPISVNGAGDAVAALFLGYCLRAQAEGKRNLRSILSRVASSIYTVLEATLHSGAREIQIIAAQDALAHPQQRFEPAYLGKLDA